MPKRQCCAKDSSRWPGDLHFETRLGFIDLMMEFPRPVLMAHRLFYGGIILYMAPSIWRMFLRPVTMLTDFPATGLASTVILVAFLSCWLNGKASWLILPCDALLILSAVSYFFARS
jgi:hypothetical protein